MNVIVLHVISITVLEITQVIVIAMKNYKIVLLI